MYRSQNLIRQKSTPVNTFASSLSVLEYIWTNSWRKQVLHCAALSIQVLQMQRGKLYIAATLISCAILTEAKRWPYA